MVQIWNLTRHCLPSLTEGGPWHKEHLTRHGPPSLTEGGPWHKEHKSQMAFDEFTWMRSRVIMTLNSDDNGDNNSC